MNDLSMLQLEPMITKHDTWYDDPWCRAGGGRRQASLYDDDYKEPVHTGKGKTVYVYDVYNHIIWTREGIPATAKSVDRRCPSSITTSIYRRCAYKSRFLFSYSIESIHEDIARIFPKVDITTIAVV
jgi:hypothetical protein